MNDKHLSGTDRLSAGESDGLGSSAPTGGEDDAALDLARWVLREFDDYYNESRQIPDLAKQAFEDRDPGQSLALSRRRLSIYSESIHDLGPRIAHAILPVAGKRDSDWSYAAIPVVGPIAGGIAAALLYLAAPPPGAG